LSVIRYSLTGWKSRFVTLHSIDIRTMRNDGEEAMRVSGIAWMYSLVMLWPIVSMGQDDDRPSSFHYATYYVCDQSTQGNMDSLVETNEAPVFDRWVEEGRLLAWGYQAHFTGGKWRRAQYHVSSTLEEAFKNQAEIFGMVYSDNREGGQARAEACAGHDDYVWSSTLGSPADAGRGDVSLAVYYVCSVADQQRADELFAEIIAPTLDEFVDDGRITGWSWLSHVLGGKFRRMQSMSGDDYATLAAARLEALRRAAREHPDEARSFNEICPTHVDYLWDIQHGSP
jgi:hypothetical protein